MKATTHSIKGTVKRLLNQVGIDIRLTAAGAGPASASRPIAGSDLFYEDIAARGFRPKSVLDVGANRGDWTRMLLRVYPEAQYLLLEPQEEMAAQLNDLAGQYHNVTWLLAAAGAAPDQLALTIWDDLNGSSLLPRVEEHLLEAGRQRMVPVAPIDSLVAQAGIPIPDLAKLDIQGYELEALKGADTLLGTTELLVIETSLYRPLEEAPVLNEVVAFMAARGYAVYDIVDYMRRPLDGALAQIDVAFALDSGALRRSNSWN